MNFDIKRRVIYIKYAGDGKSERSKEYGLDFHDITAPSDMDKEDLNTVISFFLRINDELDYDGKRYADEALLDNNLYFICLKTGAAMFKIAAASPSAELYGFFTPLSDVRTAWLFIDKLCVMLTGERTGSVTEDCDIKADLLIGLEINSLREKSATFKSALGKMCGMLPVNPYPESFALSCLPPEFFPEEVNVYDNGYIAAKTGGEQKEKELELDDVALMKLRDGCKEPMKSATLTSVSVEEESVAQTKKGGFFKKLRKGAEPESARGEIKQWRYEFVNNLQRQSENCDFIRVNEPVEYSPIIDTFNSYIGVITTAGGDENALPEVPPARIYVPGPPKPIAPLPAQTAPAAAVIPLQNPVADMGSVGMPAMGSVTPPLVKPMPIPSPQVSPPQAPITAPQAPKPPLQPPKSINAWSGEPGFGGGGDWGSTPGVEDMGSVGIEEMGSVAPPVKTIPVSPQTSSPPVSPPQAPPKPPVAPITPVQLPTGWDDAPPSVSTGGWSDDPEDGKDEFDIAPAVTAWDEDDVRGLPKFGHTNADLSKVTNMGSGDYASPLMPNENGEEERGLPKFGHTNWDVSDLVEDMGGTSIGSAFPLQKPTVTGGPENDLKEDETVSGGMEAVSYKPRSSSKNSVIDLYYQNLRANQNKNNPDNNNNS